MKKLILIVLLVAMVSAVGLASNNVVNADTQLGITSREGVLMSENGDILYQHNATEKRPIASMTKIMTLLVIYDAINSGKVKLNDDIHVSSNAASMGGSQVFLDANTVHKAERLIMSIIICSANDSCVAMAEHISGSVDNFVAQMNKKSSHLGLNNTNFVNCTGLPAPSQYSCAVDVAKMMVELAKQSHYFECSKIWMRDYVHPDGRITGMTNTNKLVKFYQGCDGGKTGFTNESMHCLSATARRGDTRLFAVIIGAKDSKARFSEVSGLLNYGFANYESKVLLDASHLLDPINVRASKSGKVEVVATKKLIAFGAKGQLESKLVLEYDSDITAPLKKGDAVGRALIIYNDKIIDSCQLVAAQDVACKSYWDYLQDAIS